MNRHYPLIRPNLFLILFISLFVLMRINHNASAETTAIIFSETFEGTFQNGYNGWTIGDSSSSGTTAYWDDVDSSFGGESTQEGNWKAYCAGYGYGGTSSAPVYQANMDAYMRRTVNLSGYTSASLTFYYKLPSTEANFDYGEVKINGTQVAKYGSAATSWTLATISLNSYVGQSITLEWNFHSDYSIQYEGWYIDNIQITGTPGSTTATVSGKVTSKLFPYNPVVGATITSDTGQSATTDAYGNYSMPNVPTGSRIITASRTDYWATGNSDSQSKTITVSGNTTVNFADFMGKGTAQVTITVDKTTAQPGDIINVTVSLKNTNYALSNVEAYLDLSFSDSRVTVGTPSGSGWNSITNYPPGSTIWGIHSDGSNYQLTSTEFLVSAYRSGSYGHNTTYSFTVPLTVRSNATTGTLTLKYRGTIADSRDPVSTGSGTRDQQGYNVYTRDISIVGFNVSNASVLINNSTGPVTVAAGSSITRSGSISGTGNGTVTYHWEYRPASGGTPVVDSNATATMSNGSATIPQTSVTVPGVGSWDYYVVVTSPNSVTSNYVRVIVPPQATRFDPGLFVDDSARIGIPLLLQAKLQKDNWPFYSAIANEQVRFDIYYNGSWHEIPDDDINTTSLTTDSSGIASVYYTAPKTLSPGTYLMRARYDGSAAYAPATLTRNLTIIKPQWLVMIYLAGDNNLESNGIDDFYEMNLASNNNNLAICVLFDRSSAYDTSYNNWTETRLYRIAKTAPIYESYGELNMGNVSSLNTLVNGCRSYIAAYNEALVIWDHGAGWMPRATDSINNNTPSLPDIPLLIQGDSIRKKGVAVDNGDYLTVEELRNALASITSSGGKLKLLGFDACLMGNIEVAYDLRSYYDIMVASEEVVPGDGWPYDTILTQIASTTDTEGLGSLIVNRYYDASTDNSTMSAIRSTKIENFVNKVSLLAEQLISLMPSNKAQIGAARSSAQVFEWVETGPRYIDIYDFADKIASQVPAAATQANAVKTAIGTPGTADSLFAAEKHRNQDQFGGHNIPHDGAHGITIYFPSTKNDIENLYWDVTHNYYNNYMNIGSYPANLLFTADKQWDDFLKVYFDSDLPTATLTQPNSNAWLRGDFVASATANDATTNILYVEFQYSLDHTNWYALPGPDSPDGKDWYGANGYALTFRTTSTPVHGTINDSSVWVRARSSDQAGNLSNWSESPYIGVDNNAPTNPTVSSPSHTTSYWSRDDTIDITWSGASDGSGSGVYGYSIVWDTSASTIPDTTIDNYGSSTTSDPLTSGTSWYFHIRTVDKAGNWNSSAVHYGPFYIDTINPLYPTSASPGCSASNDTWQKTCSDPNFTWSGASDGSGSGIAGYYYYWGIDPNGTSTTNWTTSAAYNPAAVSSPSTTYLRVQTKDNAGNTSGWVTLFTFRYDATEPTNPTSVNPNCAASDNVWQNTCSDPNFTWSGASDTGSGVAGYYYYWGIDPNGVSSSNWTQSPSYDPLPVGGDGIYYLRVQTKDVAGNTSSWATLFSFRYDNTAPSNPILTSPSHTISQWKNDNTVDINWSGATDASGSGVSGYSIEWSTLPTTLPDTIMEITDSSITSNPLADGNSWYFHIRTRDKAGLWASDAAHIGPFYIDVTEPSLPSSALEVGGAINDFWQATINDPRFTWMPATDSTAGLAGYNIYWGIEDNGTSSNWTPDAVYDPGPVPSGKYYLRAQSKDKAGNLSGWVTLFIFKYDFDPPSSYIIQMPSTSCGALLIRWDGIDWGAGIQGYDVQYRVGSTGNWLDWLINTTARQAYFGLTDPVTLVPGETYYFRVRAIDFLGNEEEYPTGDGDTFVQWQQYCFLHLPVIIK
jgi:hypothetical protein